MNFIKKNNIKSVKWALSELFGKSVIKGHSKSYGNSTAQAHGKKHPIGHEVIPGQRFMS